MANVIDSFELNIVAWMKANGWTMQSCIQVPQHSTVPAVAPQTGVVTTTTHSDTLQFADGNGNTCTVMLAGTY
jgi:hypothetical protein